VSVFVPPDGKTYRYSFYFQKRRYAGSTGQRTKVAAERVEAKLKERLREEAAGLAPSTPAASPSIADWAEVYYEHVLQSPDTISRPERVLFNLRVVLRFWGRRPSGTDPKDPIVPGAPYRDLRLADPIRDPDLVAAFEDWMLARGVSPQTRNQYRSTMRQLYRLAQQPRWRKRTGVLVNPFDGIYRERARGREVIVTKDQLRAMLAHASYHVRLAIAIGALAPKLRLASILALRWSEHFDPALTFITVHRHKTATRTGRPQVIPISKQLRSILLDARRRATSDHVITYRGQPVASIRSGVRGAALAAGVPYGRFTDDGATFHTLRHTAATILAELDVAEGKRKAVMGHQHLGTTQKYTHLRPMFEVAPVEQLSAELPIEDLVTRPHRRAQRARG